MDKLIEVAMQMVGYIPPQLMVIGIVAYLIWFSRVHTKEHKVILERLNTAETSNAARTEEMTSIYKLVLRSSIVNHSIPRSARLEMYDTYKTHGWNSWVDEYVNQNLLTPEPDHNRRKEDINVDGQE